MSSRMPVFAAACVLLSASAAFAQPDSRAADAQRDRGEMRGEVQDLHRDSNRLHAIEAQIAALNGPIHRDHGARLRADLAKQHRLQAQADRIRAGSGQLENREHADQRDYLKDEAHPH